MRLPDPNASDQEFEALVAGARCLGEGTTRVVYEIPFAPDFVLKVCKIASNVPNWTEVVAYRVYGDEGQCGLVHSWSKSGKYLVMEVLTDVGADEDDYQRFVHEWPRWHTDRKRSNVGRSLDGTLKLRDFANLKSSVPASSYL